MTTTTPYPGNKDSRNLVRDLEATTVELDRDYPERWPLLLTPLCSPRNPHNHQGEPCQHPGKVPTDTGWNAKAIERYRGGSAQRKPWLRKMAQSLAGGWNVGMVIPPGVLVLDADTPESVAWLAKAAPDAPMQTTGAGAHFVFRVKPSAEITAATGVELAPGIRVDVRAGGKSQIACAPSIHATGTPYTWKRPIPSAQRFLPYCPPVILECIADPKSGRNRSASTPKSTDGETAKILKGGRDVHLTSLAGSMRRRGMTEAAMVAALEIENEAVCIPPLPSTDIRRIARSIGKKAPAPEEPPPHGTEDYRNPAREEEAPPDELVSVRLDTVTPVEVTWLWPNYIPLRHLTLLDGDPDLGKSTIALDLGARVSRGSTMPDGSPGLQGNVLIITTEDGAADTIVPRLKVAHADLSRVHHIRLARKDGLGTPVAFPSMAGALSEKIRSEDGRLVVIDPALEFTDEKINENSAKDVRRALAALRAVAEATDCAILGIRHLNKGGVGKALYRGQASIAFIGTARSAILVYEHPEEEGLTVFDPYKGNLAAKADRPALGYRLESAGAVARVAWMDGPIEVDREAALGGGRGKPSPRAQRAIEFLAIQLAGAHSPETGVHVQQLLEKGMAEGHSRNAIYDARDELGVQSTRKIRGPAVWFIPTAEGSR